MMRTILIGCGKWGTTVAAKLQHLGYGRIIAACDVQSSAARAAAHTLGAGWVLSGPPSSELQRVSPDAAIIATPPEHRVESVRGAIAAGVKRIRCEKPLAASMADAEAIVALCQEHDVELTVGFTLLHDPLYDLALRTAQAMGGVERVGGLRIGPPSRHGADPLLDLAIHTTAVAAYIGADTGRIVCGYDPHGSTARTTLLHLADGGRIVVDETSGHAVTPLGVITAPQQRDPLARELAAWHRGEHRGTPDVALTAQQFVADHIAAQQEAAAS